MKTQGALAYVPRDEEEEVMAVSSTAAEATGLSMDVISLLRMVFRRWRVTLPAMLLTIAAVIAAIVMSPPVYQTSGSLALLNPPDPPNNAGPADPVVNADNPYVRFGDLSVVVDILARTMASEKMADKLEALGVDDYEVAANVNFERGPIIEATAREASPEESVRSSQLVLHELETVLAERQLSQQVDPAYMITVDQIEVPSDATALYGSTIRVAIAILAVGALWTLGLAILLEAIDARRRTRRAAIAAGEGPSGIVQNAGVVTPNGSAHNNGATGSPAATPPVKDPAVLRLNASKSGAKAAKTASIRRRPAET